MCHAPQFSVLGVVVGALLGRSHRYTAVYIVVLHIGLLALRRGLAHPPRGGRPCVRSTQSTYRAHLFVSPPCVSLVVMHRAAVRLATRRRTSLGGARPRFGRAAVLATAALVIAACMALLPPVAGEPVLLGVLDARPPSTAKQSSSEGSSAGSGASADPPADWLGFVPRDGDAGSRTGVGMPAHAVQAVVVDSLTERPAVTSSVLVGAQPFVVGTASTGLGLWATRNRTASDGTVFGLGFGIDTATVRAGATSIDVAVSLLPRDGTEAVNARCVVCG